jgi:hypothetical protein
MPLTGVTPTQRQTATLILAFAAGVAVGANWPKIRESLGPLLAAAGDRLGDVYASIAQALGEQKEAWEDARAERRHRARSAPKSRASEQDIFAGLADALLKGRKRPPAKRGRQRPAGRSRSRTGAGRAGGDGAGPARTRAVAEC